jgi:hypothetical protein
MQEFHLIKIFCRLIKGNTLSGLQSPSTSLSPLFPRQSHTPGKRAYNTQIP